MSRLARRPAGRRFFRRDASPRWAKPGRSGALIAGALVAAGAIALVCACIGSVSIPPGAVLRIVLAPILPPTGGEAIPTEWATILLAIRLPRVALVALSGAALAGAGTAYQGLFRNPLADPYLIGVASGAGLGAVAAAVVRLSHPFASPLLVPLAAFSGALVTVALVYALGASRDGAGSAALALSGAAISSLTTAASTLLLLQLSSGTASVLAFLLGGVGGGGWEAVVAVAPFAATGYAVLAVCARPLNLLLFDAEQASQLGVDVRRVSLAVIVAATLMTAAAVAFSGLIGFVGLIVPHAARLLVGADHSRLLPLATIGGAGFLLLADLVARTAARPQELPLGVVTATIGAPFFLWLLRRARRGEGP